MANLYDFEGWATRNDIRCADGRIIRQDAFKECDGKTVPLVWNHQHNSPDNVVGHALLKNSKGGVRALGKFNDTAVGQNCKTLVDSGDIVALSIYANNLSQRGSDVVHGVIREVSLVLAGANPGAFIDSVLAHSLDGNDDSAIIYSGEELSPYEEEDVVEHSEPEEEPVIEHADSDEPEEEKKVAEKGKTVKEVFDELTDEQKDVVYALIGQAVQEAKGEKASDEDDEGEEDMKHNLFDPQQEEQTEDNIITHSEMKAVIGDANRYGSMRESALQHGIEGIDWLFPEDKNLNVPPEWLNNNNGEWVKAVLNGVHHSPFSRVKSMFADIREDEARAKGYIKGNQKKSEVFSLLKRSTSPQTVYKTQKFDRDDVLDITDFDVISWIKAEMRLKLDEEIARAILLGDGRLASDDDKISEDHIRPIFNDANLFTVKKSITLSQNATEDDEAKAFERMAVKARKDYKGSGSPVLFTTEDLLTNMLLREDSIGRRIHTTEQELATALRVSKIVTIPEMENAVGALGGTLMGIIVNLNDYNVGADKGGAVTLFDDFDIDFNKMVYLIETRISGALVKPFSAITIEKDITASDTTDYDPNGTYARNVTKTKGMGDSTVPYPWEVESDSEEESDGGES